MSTFTENFLSHLQGPRKHCYSGVLAVGATFLVSSFLSDTTELILAVATLGAVGVYVYTLQEKNQIDEPKED